MRRALSALLWVVALGVLAQAALAGLFLSVMGGARLPHLVVGSLLPFLALVVAVVGGVAWSRRQVSPAVGLGAVTLPVLLWVQSALGHLPAPVTTAVHVPLGTALLAHVVVLALRARRPRTGGPPAPPVVPLAGAAAGAPQRTDRRP